MYFQFFLVKHRVNIIKIDDQPWISYIPYTQMLTINIPTRESHTQFSLGDRIYLVAEDQFPETRRGNMCLVNKQYILPNGDTCIIIRDNMRTPDGVSGCYAENIILDYTAHMQKVMAACKIARTWRARRKNKAPLGFEPRLTESKPVVITTTLWSQGRQSKA
jgi:hypothetical protein